MNAGDALTESFPRFGTDGVRGLANKDLTPDVAQAIGRAAAEFLGGSKVVIARDTRHSGPMLEASLAAGYMAAGVDVELVGVAPTPAVSWLCKEQGISGAMISASHNPFEDNGIKLFAPGGLKLDDSDQEAVQRRFHQLLNLAVEAGPTGDAIGTLLPTAGTQSWLGSVIGSVSPRIFEGLNIVLDCANGSASVVGPQVFIELGASVTVIGAEPDGVNINAGCGSTSPAQLQRRVVEQGADLGLAFDGDADRLVAVGPAGEIVDGDHILAILAGDWQTTGRLTHNTIVVTVMSNLGFHIAMKKRGIEVIQTGVGDRYVLEALNDGGYSLGGEQSGHVICRDLASTGDGVLAGVQLVDAVLRSGMPLSALAAEVMTSLPQVLRNLRLEKKDPTLVDRMADSVARVEKTMGSDGRVLVRASGTEPLLRVMVEHQSAATAAAVCDQLVDDANRLTRIIA